MNYLKPQGAQIHEWVGFSIVAAAHLLLGWALVTSLARMMVNAITAPVETKIIAEVKRPPPPDTPLQPPSLPDFAPPPPAFVPPPEVHITRPARVAPTIAATTAVPPTTPMTISPVLPPAPPAPLAPPAPAALAVRAEPPAPAAPTRTAPSLDFNRCDKPAYNVAATRSGATGTVVVSYVMDTHGAISQTKVEHSAGPSREHKMLDRLTVEAISRCHGRPGTVDGKPETLRGAVEYVWKLE